MYDSASFVDISQIQQKIANSSQSSVIGVTMRESNAEVLSLNVMTTGSVDNKPRPNMRTEMYLQSCLLQTVYRAENRFLFWLLIALALLIALSILTLLLCCICSWCPLYAGARYDRMVAINTVNTKSKLFPYDNTPFQIKLNNP